MVVGYPYFWKHPFDSNLSASETRTPYRLGALKIRTVTLRVTERQSTVGSTVPKHATTTKDRGFFLPKCLNAQNALRFPASYKSCLTFKCRLKVSDYPTVNHQISPETSEPTNNDLQKKWHLDLAKAVCFLKHPVA